MNQTIVSLTVRKKLYMKLGIFRVTHGGVEIQLIFSLNVALDGGERLA
jgi:hypothetical protein